MAKRRYYRTAALLGAQPITSVRRVRRSAPPIAIPWPMLLGAVTAIGIWAWLLFDPGWYISTSTLEVVSGSKETGVAAVQAGKFLHLHRFQLHEAEVEELIVKQTPAVTAAALTCDWYPAHCILRVTERNAVMAWQSDAGVQWVDREGTLFAAQGNRPNLPIVKGSLPTVDGGIPEDIVLGVLALSRLEAPIKETEYVPGRGLVWSDSQGRRVALGTGSEMAVRWQAYQSLVANLDSRKIFPWTIDVQFPGAPTYALDRAW